jgi:hypothetical protein
VLIDHVSSWFNGVARRRQHRLAHKHSASREEAMPRHLLSALGEREIGEPHVLTGDGPGPVTWQRVPFYIMASSCL